MQSSWISGSQGEQYSVPGFAQLLEARNRRNDVALQQIGDFAGELGAGIIGAVQANKIDPASAVGKTGPEMPKTFGQEAFGDKTSGFGNALRAGLMNFNLAGGGDGGSAFGRMTNPGGASSAAMNFKQFAALGKTADGLRETIGASTPTLPGQQPKILGYTDDEWKHLGTADKANAMQSWQQEQQAKATMLGYDTALQHFHQVKQQMSRTAAADAADAAFPKYIKAAQAANGLAEGRGPVQAKPLAPMEYFSSAVQAGVDPLKASAMAENLSRMNELGSQGFEFNPTTDVRDIGNGLNFVRTSRGGGQVVQTPESLSAAAKAREGAKRQVNARAVAVKDTMGNPTGEYQMQIDGDPEAVAEWIKKNGKVSATVGGGMPTVTNKAEFDALAPGSKYIGKNGKQYTKP